MSSGYHDHYLESYWPEHPNNPDMWQDNVELLSAYFLAAEKILDHEDRRLSLVDISTGPCLAPLMATMRCIDHAQLSDFDQSNRERIVTSDIQYWREYAKELVRLFPNQNLSADDLLVRLDLLRKEREPLNVDLRGSPIFLPDIVGPQSVELLSMHFVVDSISRTAEECFELLGKAVEFIRPSGWLLLSALIGSEGWQLGDETEPSPNLAEAQFDEFFEKHSIEVVTRTRSVHKPKQIYDGCWTVFLAKKQ